MCAVEKMLCGMWVCFAEGAEGIGQMRVSGLARVRVGRIERVGLVN